MMTAHDRQPSESEGETSSYTTSPVQERSALSREQLCAKCHQRPKNPPHDFCSHECGRMCELPNCRTPKHGGGSKYCSHDHRKASLAYGIGKPCVLCGEWPQQEEQGSVYCGATCTQKASATSPISRQHTSMGSTSNAPPRDRYIFPREPSPNMPPRSAYMIEFGEYNGKPNYLLRSKKGISWANLPPDLHGICEKKKADHADILDFALGSGGRFYVAYKDVRGVTTKTSLGLWTDINEDFRQGELRQLEFGPDGFVWGIKCFRDYTQSTPGLSRQSTGNSNTSQSTSRIRDYAVMEEPFGSIPDSLMEKALELYPNLMDYNQVDFVAVGAEGSWVMGIMGQLVFWDKIEAQVIKHLTRVWTETGSVRNVELSPIRPDIYFIEPAQGKVAWHVPDEWKDEIRGHLEEEHKLDIQGLKRSTSNFNPKQRPGPNVRPNTTGGSGSSGSGQAGSGGLGRHTSSGFQGRGGGHGWGQGYGASGGGTNPPPQPQYQPPLGPPPPPYQPYYTSPPPPSQPHVPPPTHHHPHRPPTHHTSPPHHQSHHSHHQSHHSHHSHRPASSAIYQYGDHQQTSGHMHAQRDSEGNGMKILTAVIKATPALLGVGLQAAALTGGCSIM